MPTASTCSRRLTPRHPSRPHPFPPDKPHPPSSHHPKRVHPIYLSDHRRKWDVRITIDVIVCIALPADTATIPAAFRSNALLSGAALLATLHTPSVRLFGPAGGPVPNPVFLPARSAHSLCARRVDLCSSLGTRPSYPRREERCVTDSPKLGAF
jgi:hypothetical protein